MAARITPAPLSRTLAEVARDIRRDHTARGREMYFGMVPYVRAMTYLDTSDLSDSFGDDRADDVVTRFLVNAGTWRGPVAQQVKAELRAALAHHAIGTHQPTDDPFPLVTRENAAQVARARQAARGRAADPDGPPAPYAPSADARRRTAMARYRASRRPA